MKKQKIKIALILDSYLVEDDMDYKFVLPSSLEFKDGQWFNIEVADDN